jgi:hypothetical protein
MPFIPVANTALTELRFTSNGQQVENTLWFEHATDPTGEDLEGLNAAVFDWWAANIQALQSSAVQLREVTSTSQTSAMSSFDTFTPPVAEFGGAGANNEPGNVTMSISFRTALRGRSARGRNYAIGLTEDQVAGNSFVTGLTALWQAAYFELIDAAAAAGWQWVVASRFSGVDPDTGDPIPRAAGVTTPITAVVVVDDNVDSQRRRLTGRGT